MWRAVGLLGIVGAVLGYSVVFMLSDVQAVEPKTTVVYQVDPANDTPAPPAPVAGAAKASKRNFDALNQAVLKLVQSSRGNVGVTLVELGGTSPARWTLNGGSKVDAASTYKLPAMMLEAQAIAAGKAD